MCGGWENIKIVEDVEGRRAVGKTNRKQNILWGGKQTTYKRNMCIDICSRINKLESLAHTDATS